jgi:hypothetical protein
VYAVPVKVKFRDGPLQTRKVPMYCNFGLADPLKATSFNDAILRARSWGKKHRGGGGGNGGSGTPGDGWK